MKADEKIVSGLKQKKETDTDGGKKGNITVCGASAYEEKYYLNPLFARMPQAVRDELQIICVMFTQDVGGIFTLEMDGNGSLQMRTESRADDFFFDEIGSVLKMKELQRTKGELFRSLELYYSLMVQSSGGGTSRVRAAGTSGNETC